MHYKKYRFKRTARNKEIDCVRSYSIPTIDKLFYELYTKYYIPKIEQKYEGRFIFYGNYYINGIDIDTIYQAFRDKKVRIEVIEKE